jgi:hypothetical protein
MKKFSQTVETVREINEKELSELQKSYRDYFSAKMNKFGVKSPAEMTEDQKKDFFNEITKDWEKGKGATESGKKDVEEHGVKESLHVNESALAIAGGIILGALGLKVIANIFRGVSAGVQLARVTEPAKLKEMASQISQETIMKMGKNPLQVVLWQKTVEEMIDKGQITNGIQLAKTIKGIDDIDIKKVFESEETEPVNESFLVIGGAILLTVLGIQGIRRIFTELRIQRNLDKPTTPEFLKTTVTKIYNDGKDDLSVRDRELAKKWMDEMIVLIDKEEIVTVRGLMNYVQAQDAKISVFEYLDVNEAKINEKDIKNKEDFAAFVKDKLKKVHGKDYDEKKAQEVIDGLSKDAEKSGDWGAAVGKLNKA